MLPFSNRHIILVCVEVLSTGSVSLLPTQLCPRAGEVVLVCTESPRQHEVHAHEDLPLKNLLVRPLLVQDAVAAVLAPDHILRLDRILGAAVCAGTKS